VPPGGLPPGAAAALGTLLAGGAGAALEDLDVSHCAIGDDGLAPLVAALPRAPRLKSLCCCGNALSRRFATGPLLNAARSAPHMRYLDTIDEYAAE
jgi:hypothetical protein